MAAASATPGSGRQGAPSGSMADWMSLAVRISTARARLRRSSSAMRSNTSAKWEKRLACDAERVEHGGIEVACRQRIGRAGEGGERSVQRLEPPAEVGDDRHRGLGRGREVPPHHRLFDAQEPRLGPGADGGGARGRGEGGDLAHQFARGDDGDGDALPAVLDLHRHLAFEDEVGPGPEVALEEQRLAGRGAVDRRAGREAGEVGRRDRGEARRRAQHPHDAVRVAMVDGSVHALRRRSPCGARRKGNCDGKRARPSKHLTEMLAVSAGPERQRMARPARNGRSAHRATRGRQAMLGKGPDEGQHLFRADRFLRIPA
jgi:hypothetical protein